jgi:hypothetical protein
MYTANKNSGEGNTLWKADTEVGVVVHITASQSKVPEFE